jgi:glycosyltransferase involved in cell wall biosynthesis
VNILIHAVAMRKQGGGSRHLYGFIDALGQLDTQNNYILCLDKSFPFESKFANITVEPIEVRSQWQRLWWDQIKLPKLVQHRQIDLILAIFNFGCFKPPVPQIVLQRNALYYCGLFLKTLKPFSRLHLDIQLRRLLAYWTMRGSVAVVVPSVAMRDMISKYHSSIPLEKFVVIPHAFNLDHFRSHGELSTNLQACLDAAPEQAHKLLYISHLEPHKEVATTVAIAKYLVQTGENFRLYLTLDRRDAPAEFDALQQLIVEQGLSDYIVNLGRVAEQEVYQLYKQCDIFLFPSLCESFGFPMKEALALGLPIVASDTAINRELCGEAALYFPPSDSLAASIVIRKLLTDKNLLAQLGERATQQYATTTSNWEDYTRRMLNLSQEKAERFHVK